MTDWVAIRNNKVWVDGHGYRSHGAAHALEALGAHVRWYDLETPTEPTDDVDLPPAEDTTDIRLPYKDN